MHKYARCALTGQDASRVGVEDGHELGKGKKIQAGSHCTWPMDKHTLPNRRCTTCLDNVQDLHAYLAYMVTVGDSGKSSW